jgi:hypothetical protein
MYTDFWCDLLKNSHLENQEGNGIVRLRWKERYKLKNLLFLVIIYIFFPLSCHPLKDKRNIWTVTSAGPILVIRVWNMIKLSISWWWFKHMYFIIQCVFGVIAHHKETFYNTDVDWLWSISHHNFPAFLPTDNVVGQKGFCLHHQLKLQSARDKIRTTSHIFKNVKWVH